MMDSVRPVLLSDVAGSAEIGADVGERVVCLGVSDLGCCGAWLAGVEEHVFQMVEGNEVVMDGGRGHGCQRIECREQGGGV